MYLGIDPGASGGLAIISSNPSGWDMPSTERDIWELIDHLSDSCDKALIEWIHPAIQGIGKSPMSKLYGNYMACRMALVAAEIPFDDVKPAAWQKELGMKRSKDEKQHKWKGRLKQKAQQLFPQCHVTLKTADALLIAEYCRRIDSVNHEQAR